jgi:LysM repeat protein
MRKITLLAISFFCLLRTATAQYFIQYDPSCMDKLEYRIDDNADGKNFITFRLNKSATEKYFFQIGLDNPLKPTKTVHPIPCKDAFLDEDAMSAVNEGRKNAYIVINTPNGTRLYSIGSISYVVTGENLLSFVGNQYTFASDLLTPYENLAAQDSRSQVYFIGTETLHGKTVYHFRVEPLTGSTNVISRTFRYAPHIGIISETVPENGAEHQIDLKSVNGKALEDYFASVDDKLPIVILHDAPETVAETSNSSSKSTHSTSTTTTASTKIKARQANEDGTYEIKAGDNLYSVSRSFGITLGQLRAWNNLVSDDILPGSKLLVQAPPKIKPSEALNMKGSFYEIDPGTAVTIPDEYEAKMKQKKAAAARLKNKGGETTTQKSEEAKARAVLAKGGAEAQVPLFVKREKDSGLHIIQKGETIASMAKKYKVTEAKFRRLNGLGTDEAVRTGQVVKISECVCEDDKPAAATTPAPYSNHSKKLSPKGGNEESVVMVNGKKCHIAKDGETLYSISKKHGLSVEKLRQYNRMANSDLVVPKQKLFLE